MTEKAKAELTNDLAAVLNKHCAENPSNTPDFILAGYLVGCLQTWNAATKQRERWYGRVSEVATPPAFGAVNFDARGNATSP